MGVFQARPGPSNSLRHCFYSVILSYNTLMQCLFQLQQVARFRCIQPRQWNIGPM